jgi:arylsulfatase A-like enzyme
VRPAAAHCVITPGSDHGYSLGELNLNWDKRNVYDFDTRIHLLIKGPGIKPGSKFEFLASNVDLAPTMLSLASIDRAPGMDGKSFLPIMLDAAELPKAPGSVQRYAKAHAAAGVQAGWRDTHFIEYYYIGIGG